VDRCRAALALGTLIKVPGAYGFAAVFLWQAFVFWRLVGKRRQTLQDALPMIGLVAA
jgi:hypothetical protein